MAITDIYFQNQNYFPKNNANKNNLLIIRIKLIIFGLLGLAPFTLNIDSENVRNRDIGKKPRLKFIHSYIMAGCNLIIIVFAIVMNVIFLPTLMRENPDDHSPLSKSVELHLIVSGNFTLIFLLLIFLLRYRTMINMANKLIDVDMTLEKLRDNYELESGKLRLIVISSLNTLFCLLHIIDGLFSPYSLALISLSVLHRIIFSYFILQYVIVLSLIEKRFKSLNNSFLKLSKLPDQFNYCDDCDKPKITINRMMVIEVIALKRSHTVLCGMCNKVADFYSMGVLLIITYSTASIIYGCYHIIMPFVRPKYYPQSVLNRVRLILWLMIELFPIFSLATYANKTIGEMKKTTHIIHKILSQCNVSPDVNTELKHFLLELPHNDYEFSAYNVITVDSTIIRSIFSSVVSNLIIFIQFQLDGLKRSAENQNH